MALIGASNSLGGLSGSNTVARLLVVISGDSTSLTAALGKTEASLKGFGANASAIGSALTRTVTLPFLALAGGALKVATDFNTALTRVAALTPVLDKSKEGFAGLEKQILDLANRPEIVATPTDLANALYFAGSAGLKTAQAFNVVKLAAEGQSVGMGDAADIAKVLIFAMNNYRSEGLKAADAMDALTAAVREGTAEPADLAVALGRLLPIAHQAGVTFQEVVASVAALTNLGVPARVATTSLRALFGGLLAPTQAANDELKTLGITADQLRYKLQQGPLEAFQAITDATKGNADATRLVIPQIRALTAFYGLAGTELTRYKAVIDSVNHSQGTLSKVISQFERTPGFKFQKLLQQLQVAGIELGNALIPTFLKIIDIIGNMVKVFEGIPDLGKQFLAGFLVIGALIGPLTKIYGIIQAFGTSGVASMKALATGFVTAGIAAAAAVGGFLSLAHGSKDLFSIATTLIGTLVAVKIALSGLVALSGKISFLSFFSGLTAPEITGIAIAIGLVATAVGYLAGGAARASKDVQNLRDVLYAGFKGGETVRQAFDDGGSLSHLSQDIRNVAEGMGLLNKPLAKASDILQSGLGGVAIDSFHRLRVALDTTLSSWNSQSDAVVELRSRIDTLDDHIKGSGRSVEAVSETFDKWGVISGQTGTDLDAIINSGLPQYIRNLGSAAKDAQGEWQAFRDTVDKYNQDQIDAVRLSNLNQTAIESFARKTGTSVDYIQQAVSSSGFMLAGASKKALDVFKRQTFGVTKADKIISGSVAEARDAVASAADDMASSFDQMFNIFEKAPKIEKGPDFSSFLGRLKDQSKQAVQLATDVQTLSSRGVPFDLIQRMVDQGPAAVHKFANASKKELQKYVGYFETYLAAGDAEVLKEGAHLETKGTNNIQRFVTGMLKQQTTTRSAARTIVGSVTNEVINGTLEPAALNLIQSFVNGMKGAKDISAKEADKMTFAFIKELHDKHNFTKDGKLIIKRVANGMAQATGLPKTVIIEALSGLSATLSDNGAKAIEAFAAGIRSNSNIPKAAANQIATVVTNALLSGDLTSVGASLVTDFTNGIAAGGYHNIKGEGGALTLAFVDAIRNKHNYDADGILIMNRVAKGISHATGIPVKQVNLMLSDVRAAITGQQTKLIAAGGKVPAGIAIGMDNNQGKLVTAGKTAGREMMRSFATAVTDNLTLAITSVGKAGDEIKAIFQNHLHASPQYASYHYGVKWIEQFNEGMNHARFDTSLVDKFVTAMLSQQSLTRGATRQLIASVTNEIYRGDLKPGAVKLIESFVSGLENGPPLSAKEADKLTVAFVKQLHDKHNFTDDGKLIISRVAAGIAQGSGLPKAAIVKALLGLPKATISKAFSGLGDALRTEGGQALLHFIEGMQGKKGFARDSVRGIIATVVAEFKSGNLDAAGLQLITDFVDGIKNGSSDVKAQGGELTLAFIHELRDKHNYHADGTLIMHRVAKGISDSTGVPIKQVGAMLKGVRGAIDGQQGKLQQSGKKIPAAIEVGMNQKLGSLKAKGAKAGKGFMHQFGVGVVDGLAEVITTVQSAATDIVGAFDAFLHASPQYASYHMGVQFVEDFNKGLHHGRLDTGLVQNFVNAMLRQQSLTRNAGRRIIASVTNEVFRGDLKPAALNLIQSFVTGLDDGPPLSAKAADALTVAFVKELHDKHNFTQDGKLIISQVVNGMAQTTGLPKSVIRGALTGLSNTLAEGGAKSIKAFAAGIRGQKNISKGAADEIIGVVTRALLSGNLKPEGVAVVSEFVAGLKNGPPKAKREAGKVTTAFVHELTNKHNYDRDGVLIMSKIAAGMSAATHIPVKQVNQMLGHVASAVRDKQARLTRAGKKIPAAIATGMDFGLNVLQAAGHKAGSTLMGSFVQGVKENKGQATAAAAKAAGDINKAFENHLHASPQYASYHYGVNWIEQFNEGMRATEFDTSITRKLQEGFGQDLFPKAKDQGKKLQGGFGYDVWPKRRHSKGMNLFLGETKKGMKGYNATLKKGLHDGDNAVLNEGKHLKGKGKKNMKGFIGGVKIGGKDAAKAGKDTVKKIEPWLDPDWGPIGLKGIKSWRDGFKKGSKLPWQHDTDKMIKLFGDSLRKGAFRDDGRFIAKELLTGFNDGKKDITNAMHLGSRRHQTSSRIEHRFDGRQHSLHSPTATRPHKTKLDVKLSVDRRKFTDGLTYDSTYRGW